MDGLTPTFDIGGGHGAGFGGPLAGAFAGGLFGSWFGNGWGGGGYGGRGAVGGAVVAETAVLDAISNIGNSVNSGNIAAVQGFGGLNASVESSAAATQMAVLGAANGTTQAVNAVGSVVQQGNFNLQSALCQGFGGLNTSVLVASKDNALLTCESTNAITSAINNCCCNTQKTIMAEACATRELIKDVQYQNTRDQLCQARDEISTLKSQNFTAASVAGLGNQVRNEMGQAVNTILTHLMNCKTTTPAS